MARRVRDLFPMSQGLPRSGPELRFGEGPWFSHGAAGRDAGPLIGPGRETV